METLMQPTETKARKVHRCDFCAERIAIGDKYIKSTHKYEGDVYDWKTHDYCSELASTMKLYDDADEGVGQDDFMEAVSEKYNDLLINQFTDNDAEKYKEIVKQLHEVRFRQKLHYVIMHYKKLEKQTAVAVTPNEV